MGIERIDLALLADDLEMVEARLRNLEVEVVEIQSQLGQTIQTRLQHFLED